MFKNILTIHLFCLSFLFAQNQVNIITVDGVINPVSQEFIRNAIKQAEEDGAQCLVIEMDTPGGLMKSMRMIVKDIMGSEVPVVVYVAPSGAHAGSAGVYITYASHIAAMAPGTNIGAASPVTMGAGSADSSNATMMKKAMNDAAAMIRSLAEKRSRNAEWAEEAVREAVSITELEALEKGVIEYVAPSLDSLLSMIDGKEIETVSAKVVLHTKDASKKVISMSWRHRILDVISDPNIAYILLLIGMYGIFFELYNPGSIFPGVIGAICLILGFYALQTLPINYAGLLLIILAIILFLLEIKIPSYGVLSIGGVISMIIGSIMLFDSPMPFLRVSWKVILIATVLTALFFIFAVGMGIRAQRRKPTTGREGLKGETGEAVENFKDGKGQASILGEIWQAESEDRIKAGDEVEVVKTVGLKVQVKRIKR
jgi:membrane-bound serine protease (ClpP class)